MKRAFTLLEALILVGVVAIIAAFLLPVFVRGDRIPPRYGCQSNLKQIGLGFIQYTQDYDNLLPSARLAPTLRWADAIAPYVRAQQLFECPATRIKQYTSSGLNPVASDYFYNGRLSGAMWNKLPWPAMTILAGDGEDNAPTWNSWNGLPSDATTNSYSPCVRHSGETANYLFADGHVKYLIPATVSSTFARPTSRYTFAIR